MSIYTFKIQTPNKIPSLNDMYKIGRSKTRSWLYLNPQVKNWKDTIVEQLIKQGIKDISFDDKFITLQMIFVMGDNFWVRDVSNTIKATEDAVVQATGRDDRFNVEVNTSKVFNDLDGFEYVIIGLELHDMSKYTGSKWSDYIQQPE